MLYGKTGKPKPPLSPEEKKAEEERQRKERRNEIILTAIIHTLMSPILLLTAIISVIYVGVANGIDKIREWKDNGWKRHRNDEEEDVSSSPKLISYDWIECNHELPVILDKFYVIYVETKYNETLNSFIRENIEYIRKGFLERNYHFVYIPELKNISDEDLDYVFPLSATSMTDETKNGIRNITTEQFTRMFASLIGMSLKGGKAGLLSLGYYEGDDGIELIDNINYSKSEFLYVDLCSCSPDNIKNAFGEYFQFCCGKGHALFCVRPREEYPLNDWQEHEHDGYQTNASDRMFYYEQKDMELIAEEIRQRVEILKQGGYIELLLHTLGADLVKQVNDSRKTANAMMHISVSENLRIYIPELDNREIKMTALARALYVFYLRHEEGVEFKFLSEFTEELFSLYRLASNRIDDSRLRSTVENLVNPTDNKINECASRIKAAFLSVMDEYMARNYYLLSRSDEIRMEDSKDKNVVNIYKDLAKYISLPRNLVSYPSSLKNIPFVKGHSFNERRLKEEECERRLRHMKDTTVEITKLKSAKRRWGKKRKTELQRLRLELLDATNAVLELEPNNFLAHFNLGEIYCNANDYAKSIQENTMLIDHDAYTWNAAYINRAEAYLNAGEYDKGLADIQSYFNSLRRWKEADEEAERIKTLLMKRQTE